MDMLMTRTMKVLDKALDAASLRHEAISDNIANAETPGYKAKRVAFEDELRSVLARRGERLSERDLPAPKLYRVTSTFISPDGNNVDMEAEMAALAENEARYSALSQLLAKNFALLRYVISEGRR